MIYLLFVFLFLILALSYYIYQKEILAPSFIFSASFFFSSIWAMAYSKRWELGLHFETFFLLVGGALEFLIVCVATSFFYRNINRQKRITTGIPFVEVGKGKTVGFIIFQIATIIFTITAKVASISSVIVHMRRFFSLSYFLNPVFYSYFKFLHFLL